MHFFKCINITVYQSYNSWVASQMTHMTVFSLNQAHLKLIASLQLNQSLRKTHWGFQQIYCAAVVASDTNIVNKLIKKTTALNHRLRSPMDGKINPSMCGQCRGLTPWRALFVFGDPHHLLFGRLGGG